MKKILLTFLLSFISPLITLAQECVGGLQKGKIIYCPLEPNAFSATEELTSSTTLTEFLSQAFSLGLAICAALAVVMIVWGGVEYMLSESVFSKNKGKERIRNAIYGLLLALFSWLILYIINPSILDWSRFTE